MKKTFMLEDLECAHCAAKMEEAIRKLEGVTSANINFFAQKLTIEGDDARFDRIVKEAAEACRKVEPDCTLVVK
jgi:copper chaperone CopZ